jgi:hypothetical protein
MLKYIALFTTALVLATLAIPSATFAEETPAAGESVDWQVVAGGGAHGSSTNYILEHTVGQTAAGMGESPGYLLNQGFQQNFGEGFICGDADGSGNVSIGDAVFIVNYIFGGGPAPNPLASADADCSGNVSIGDAVFIVTFIFGGGPAPCSACP